MTDNELLLAISDMMDKKNDVLKNEFKNDILQINVTLENKLQPNIMRVGNTPF